MSAKQWLDVIIRCAIYGRYSSDQQRTESLVDQERNCRTFAAHAKLHDKKWKVLDEYVFGDEAVTGTARDRAQFQALLAVALQPNPPFQYILVDSTSRVARDVVISLDTCRRLRFNGVFVFFIAQNIDTAAEDYETLLAMHGIMDAQYLKKLGYDTHRGMAGTARKGWATGGKTFGLATFPIHSGRLDPHGNPIPDGYDYKIDAEEANVVVRIFHLFADDGWSCRKIAFALNDEKVPYPRQGDKNDGGGWGHTTVRSILRNEKYIGTLCWNTTKWQKVPGTKLRRPVERPREEWTIVERPDLVTIDRDLWDKAHARIKHAAECYGERDGGRLVKPLNRAGAKSTYLLSGLLRCGCCKGHIVVTGGNKRGRQHRRYGCRKHFDMGPARCSNSVTVLARELEDVLATEMRERLATRTKLEESVAIFRDELATALKDVPDRKADLDVALAKVRREITNYVRALGAGVDANSVRDALKAAEEREQQLVAEAVKVDTAPRPADITVHPDAVRRLISDVTGAFGPDIEAGREALRQYLGPITVRPVQADGTRAYEIEGFLDATTILAPPKRAAAGAGIRFSARSQGLSDGACRPPLHDHHITRSGTTIPAGGRRRGAPRWRPGRPRRCRPSGRPPRSASG